ncbi:MAG: hypothetical protein JRN52_05585 [Nitrososphaerota archaeon]|nr:hypothetical protein [Nitrososphaerota archaeon]
MNQDEISQKFKNVSTKVEALAKQQESEIAAKVDAIKDNAVKKFSGAASSR